MARLAVAAAGNAEQNINLINARFQAEALRALRGYDIGVLSNSFYSSSDPRGAQRDANADFMWKINATNIQNITVGRGMATAYGFDIQSEETVHFTATAPSAGTKYLFIYLQWDFSNPVEAEGKIDIHDNGSNASWTPPRQDNLITNPIGTYQLPLYRLAVNTAGSVTSIANWSSLGITTIEQPLYAQYAGRAANADKATDYNTSSGGIKTEFDGIKSRLNTLGFKSGSVTLAFGSATQNSVRRQGNYAIINLEFTHSERTKNFAEGDLIATLPSNFRAASAQYVGAFAYTYKPTNISDRNYYWLKLKIEGTSITVSERKSIASNSSTAFSNSAALFLINGGYEAASLS